jgi:type IV pilus assembly protein PilW
MKTQQQSAHPHPGKHSGFTIVEIMVALVISLILLLGVIQIFMASKATYTMQSGAARLQENARFALDFMSRSLGMAGGPSVVNAINVADTHDNYSSQTFSPATGTILPVAASDTISVNYIAATDCQGEATVGGVATDIYFVAVDTADPDPIPNLYCNNGGDSQPLVEGVDNLQILYGQDIQGGPDGIADRYVSAANVSNWNQIASIRVAVLVNAVDDSGVTNSNTYRVLNSPELGPFNDNLLRHVFTRTILVRNYLP